MASAILVDEEIDQGRSLLALLDQIKIPVVGAFWFYYPDSERWRLTIVSPLAEHGSRDLYARCIEAGATINMSLVEFVPPKNAIFRALSVGIQMHGTNVVRVSQSVFNGVYVDEAVLYRLAA